MSLFTHSWLKGDKEERHWPTMGSLQTHSANSKSPWLLDPPEWESSTAAPGSPAQLKTRFAVRSAGSLEKVMSDNSKEKPLLIRQQTLGAWKRSKWLSTQSRQRLAPPWPWEMWMLSAHPFWLAVPLLTDGVAALPALHSQTPTGAWFTGEPQGYFTPAMLDLLFSHLQKSKYSHTYHLPVTPQNSLLPFQVEICRFVTLWGLDEWSPASCQEHRQLWLCAWLCCAAVN